MFAPVSNSNPYLAIARHHNVDYGAVLSLVDYIRAPDLDSYWQREARLVIREHPRCQSIQLDVRETMQRLGHVFA